MCKSDNGKILQLQLHMKCPECLASALIRVIVIDMAGHHLNTQAFDRHWRGQSCIPYVRMFEQCKD